MWSKFIVSDCVQWEQWECVKIGENPRFWLCFKMAEIRRVDLSAQKMKEMKNLWASVWEHRRALNKHWKEQKSFEVIWKNETSRVLGLALPSPLPLPSPSPRLARPPARARACRLWYPAAFPATGSVDWQYAKDVPVARFTRRESRHHGNWDLVAKRRPGSKCHSDHLRKAL